MFVDSELVGVRATVVRDRDGLTTPDEFCAAEAEMFPPSKRQLSGPAAGCAVPSFHRLDCEAISEMDAAQNLAHAANHRTQRDDRGDADGNADEKENEAVPRRARLPDRHAEHELHVRSTTRPSRRISRTSARAARSVSCVTSTIVVPRV